MKNDDKENFLWKAFLEGSKTAFHEIYESHYADLLKYGLHINPDGEIVKDAIHDVFVKIWNNKSSLTPTLTRILPYLCVALKGTLYNYTKKEGNRAIKAQTLLDTYRNSSGILSDFDSDIENYTRSYDTLKRLFEKLTQRQREVLYLRYIKSMEYEEVGEVLHLTTKATYKLVARALQSLKSQLNTEEQRDLKEKLQFFLIFF